MNVECVFQPFSDQTAIADRRVESGVLLYDINEWLRSGKTLKRRQVVITCALAFANHLGHSEGSAGRF